jgi:enoyl-[acyl-carrier protein] reductase II
MFGIKHPILNAGMGRTALPNMVAAVCNAGGLGVLGAGSSPPAETRKLIREVRALTDLPFGINCPLALPNAKENAKIAIEEQVPVINYSMGRGDWIAKAAHQYGGKAIASVNSVQLAQKAQDQGADAVIAAGHEAAGHAGAITTFVFLPRLAELLSIPIIAAGGVANGKGLAAAITLGASGVSMGTRMWTTQEGPMHDNWKQLALKFEVSDTLFSDKFDGILCRQMNTELPRRMLRRPINVFQVLLDSVGIARELQQPYFKLFFQILIRGPKTIDMMMRMSQALKAHTITMTTGDLKTGMTSTGQSVGLIHDLPTIAEVIERIVAEAEAEQQRVAGVFAK